MEDYRIAHLEIDIQADFFFDELMLSSSLRIVTFRIVQESMNNIRKHSNATQINIQILHEDDFRIIIKDNGKGFSLDEPYKQGEDGEGKDENGKMEKTKMRLNKLKQNKQKDTAFAISKNA